MDLTCSLLTILSTTIVLVMWGADELWLIGAIANVCDMIWYDIWYENARVNFQRIHTNEFKNIFSVW